MNITFEDFKKLEIKIGKVLSCEKVEGADRLLKLEVDFGPSASSGQNPSSSLGINPAEQNVLEENQSTQNSKDQPSDIKEEKPQRMIRQIVSGIAKFYQPEDLIGKEFPFIVNLEPRVIRGIESQGMIIAVDTGNEVILLNPDKEVPPGSIVR